MFVLSGSDYSNRCPVEQLAKILAEHEKHIYVYEFERGPTQTSADAINNVIPLCDTNNVTCYNWCSHAGELNYIFGTRTTINGITLNFGDNDNKISK